MCSRLVLGPFFFFILLFSSSIHSAFSSDISSATIGDQVTLSWSSSASSCTASGSWSGSKPGSGTEQVTLPAEGWNMFTLNCGASWEYVWVWGDPEVFQQTNNPPIISGLSSSISVEENQTSVLSVTASDAEGDPISYSLSGTDSSYLSISLSGVLAFNAAPDYETKNSYSITVNVSDGTVTTSQALIINITDVDETSVSTSSSNASLTAGYYHYCVIDDSGVVCWGMNGNDQTDVPVLLNPKQVEATPYGACALDDNGVVCWGGHDNIIEVPSLVNPTMLTKTRSSFICALDDTGMVCWGRTGGVGTGVRTDLDPTSYSFSSFNGCGIKEGEVICWGNVSQVTSNVPPLSNPIQIEVSDLYACALDDNGVQCWGWDSEVDYGQTDVPYLSNPTQIEVHLEHACAIDDSGVVCWGRDIMGATNPPNLSNPKDLALGHLSTCALDDNGVVCWGWNDDGQTNVPNLSFTNSSIGASSSEEIQENQTTLSSIYKVATGVNNTCVIDDRGLSCWGDNTGGKSDVPSTLSNPIEVSPGGAMHTCAIDDSGVVCWGLNADGRTSPPTISNPKIITSGWDYSCVLDDYGVACWGNDRLSNVPFLTNPTHIDAGHGHACAIDNSGLVCWGDNSDGKTDVPSLSNPTGISAGRYHTCAIENSDVVCWGNDSLTSYSNKPVLTNVVSVVAAEQHTCALDDNGVHCWGLDGFGAATVPPLTNPIQVDTRDAHTCALDQDGLTCWGFNSSGQTDVPNNLSFTNTVTISGSSSTSIDDSSSSSESGSSSGPSSSSNSSEISLTTDGDHICVIDDSGVVQCWGRNTYGQTTVPNLSNPTQVSAGNDYTCALDDNGVQCWGRNSSGQTTVPSLSNPTQVSAGNNHACALDDNGVHCWGNDIATNVPSLSNPTLVSAGDFFTCALDDNGVQCWGHNDSGQTTVPSLSNPTQISTGGGIACALDDNGVQCWGNNYNGETNVPSLSNPTQISTGWSHTCALDNNGVQCWGYNNRGQTVVPSLSNPTLVSAGDYLTCALDDNGLQCWGDNTYGQLAVPEGLTFTTTSSSNTSSSSNSSSSSSSNSDSSSSGSTDSSSSSSYDSSFFNTSDENSGDQQEGSGNNSCNNLELGVQDSSFSFGGFVNIGSFGGFGDNLNTSCNSIDGVLYASSPSAAEVFIDQNITGIKDFTEPSDITSSSGNFSISGINDQEYECLKNKPLIATLSSGEDFYSIDPYNLSSAKTITAFSSLRDEWPRRKEHATVGCEDFPALAALRRGGLKELDLRLQQGFDVSLNDLLKDPREVDLSSPITEERASAIEAFIRSAEIIEKEIFNEFSSEFSTAGVQLSSLSWMPIENYSIFLSNTYPNPTTKTNPIVNSIDQVSVRMNAMFTASLENAVGPWDSYATISTKPLISNAGELIEDRDSCFVSFSSLCKIDPSFLGLFQYPRTVISWVYHQSTAKGEEIVKEIAQIQQDGSCLQVNEVNISDNNSAPSSATTRDYHYSNISYNGYFDFEILECQRQNSSSGHRELAFYEWYPSGASAGMRIVVPYDAINDSTINLLSGLDNFNWESIDSGNVVPPSIPSNFSARFQELSFNRQMYDSLPWDESSGISGYSFSEVSSVFFTMTDKNGYSTTLINGPGYVACIPASKQIVFSSASDLSKASQVVDNCFGYLDKDFIWPDTVDDTIFNNPDAFSTLDPYDQ